MADMARTMYGEIDGARVVSHELPTWLVFFVNSLEAGLEKEVQFAQWPVCHLANTKYVGVWGCELSPLPLPKQTR